MAPSESEFYFTEHDQNDGSTLFPMPPQNNIKSVPRNIAFSTTDYLTESESD